MQLDSFFKKKGNTLMDLQHLIGKSVSRIRRIYFVFQGTIDMCEGALELCFHDGSFLLIDAKSDWTLHVEQEEWSDPFAPPLTKENSEFVRDYGTWSAFDRSSVVPARFFLGRTVSAFQEIRDEVSQIMGIVLEFDEFVVKASSYGGEIRVEWKGPDFSYCDIPSIPAPE